MKFQDMHSWHVNVTEAIAIQNKLKRKIKLKGFKIKSGLVAGADVAFKGKTAIAVVVVLSLPRLKIVEYVRKVGKITYPYVPGLLAFREGPILVKCFRALKNKPDVIIFDGQGIAHPRNMGIATHMGILLNKSTIGCAKTWLWGKYSQPQKSRGSFSYILDNRKRRIGVVLRTKNNVRPVFVSCGNKIDLKSCIKIILMLTQKYRLPEPLRLAHQLSNK